MPVQSFPSGYGPNSCSWSSDSFRTDIAERAIKALKDEGLDVDGKGFEKTDVVLLKGGD